MHITKKKGFGHQTQYIDITWCPDSGKLAGISRVSGYMLESGLRIKNDYKFKVYQIKKFATT